MGAVGGGAGEPGVGRLPGAEEGVLRRRHVAAALRVPYKVVLPHAVDLLDDVDLAVARPRVVGEPPGGPGATAGRDVHHLGHKHAVHEGVPAVQPHRVAPAPAGLRRLARRALEIPQPRGGIVVGQVPLCRLLPRDVVDGALCGVIRTEKVPAVQEARPGVLLCQRVVPRWGHARLGGRRRLRWACVEAVVEIEEGGQVGCQQNGDQQPEGAAHTSGPGFPRPLSARYAPPCGTVAGAAADNAPQRNAARRLPDFGPVLAVAGL
mmetsp:Transcript_17258/g.43820  ORF Transcript_17258/g.43820 Transcript_17258/m.43820 type:complete len:264 (-) Transcript_17258:100-891(-)